MHYPHWQRPKTKTRGYSGKHVTWFRANVLARDPECRYAFDVGCTHVSTIADHLIPMSQGGDPFDLENGIGCCAHCHGIKSKWESIQALKRQWQDRRARAPQPPPRHRPKPPAA